MAERHARQERRQQRQRERRQFLSLSSLFALAFGLSFVGALYVAWQVYPLTETAASPAVLRSEFKADYIYMVGQGFAQDGDWPRAQARLDKLADPALADTTLALLESALREGRPPDAIRNLARLAEQLGAEGDTLALFAPTPVVGGGTTVLPTPSMTPSPSPQLLETVEQGLEITATLDTVILPSITPTLLTEPTIETAETPIPEQTGQYRLLSQREICVEDDSLPRIEITVVDAGLVELRGAEILLEWEGGGDRAITGFKSEASAGYADFTIGRDASYTVLMTDGSGTVGGLQTTVCAEGDGHMNWILRYQRLNSE